MSRALDRPALTAAVLAIGDELLLGDLVNTNAAWLGQQCAAAGVRVVSSAVVGDDIERIAAAVSRGLQDAQVVLLTGGLGPTSDDVTRSAVALVAGVPLERSASLEDELRVKFAAYGYVMPDSVLVQADVPQGARVLDNPLGSAPGLVLQVGDQLVVAVPGPPHEMKATVAPVLAELAARSGTVVVTRTLHCAGVGESDVADRIGQALSIPAGVALAYLAGSGGVVRVRFTGTTVAQLQPLVDAATAALGRDVFGFDDDTLPGVVSALLRDRGATVGTAESLTGGLLASALVDLPGSSDVFRGGLLPYATKLKTDLVGVEPAVLSSHGAVSEQTALALARGARGRTGATYGLATTGVAGPAAQDGHPAGTMHVAVVGPSGERVISRRLPGDRQRVRHLAVTLTLDLLRRTLTDPG